jgi:hypothetical protein
MALQNRIAIFVGLFQFWESNFHPCVVPVSTFAYALRLLYGHRKMDSQSSLLFY